MGYNQLQQVYNQIQQGSRQLRQSGNQLQQGYSHSRSITRYSRVLDSYDREVTSYGRGLLHPSGVPEPCIPSHTLRKSSAVPCELEAGVCVCCSMTDASNKQLCPSTFKNDRGYGDHANRKHNKSQYLPQLHNLPTFPWRREGEGSKLF